MILSQANLTEPEHGKCIFLLFINAVPRYISNRKAGGWICILSVGPSLIGSYIGQGTKQFVILRILKINPELLAAPFAHPL